MGSGTSSAAAAAAAVGPLPRSAPGAEWLEVRPLVWLRIRRLRPQRPLPTGLSAPDASVGPQPRSADAAAAAATVANGRLTDWPQSRAASPPQAAAEGALLFFVHGVGGSSDVWLSQLGFFAQLGYEVVAPDLVGHGLSSTPRDPSSYEFNSIASDLQVVFEKYKRATNVLVGHSYGTSFVTFIAYHKPWDVSKLILISAGAPLPLAPARGAWSMPAWVLRCLRPVIRRTFTRKAFHGIKKEHLSLYNAAFNVPGYVFRNIMIGQLWKEGGAALHQSIRTPTLIIFGEHDQLGTLEDAIAMNETMPVSHLRIVTHCGHMVMMEQSAIVNSLIEAFLFSRHYSVTGQSRTRVAPHTRDSADDQGSCQDERFLGTRSLPLTI